MTDTGTIADQYQVYVGLWTNWSRGPIMGTTLTLKQADTNILIAFIAIFTAFVSGCFWKIVRFALHRSYSTSGPQSATYHQCQAILRNCSTAEESFILLSQVLWTNRLQRRLQRRFRLIFAAIIAIICFVAFTVGGIFSSFISTSVGNEVLIKSVNCGYVYFPSTPSSYYPFSSYLAKQIDNAANYAQRCYSNDSSGYLNCGTFIRDKLAFNINTTADCPFQNEICRKPSSNLRLDTGYIDSHSDFGLNTPPDQRFQWRNILHCAPLVTEGYTHSRNTTSLGNMTFYNYGQVNSGDGAYNYTYAAQAVESQYALVLSKDTFVRFMYYRLE